MSVLGALQLLGLALLMAVLVGALLGHVLTQVVLPWVLRGPAVQRHPALLLLASAPLGLALLLFGAALAPSLASLVFPALDHCLVHDDGHAHLCFVHLPASDGSALAWGVLGALTGLLMVGAISRALRLLRAGRLVAQLLANSRPHGATRARLVPTPAPLCLTVGLFKPEVAISEALFAGLAPAAREVLLAHEQEHVRRRDPLVQLLAELAAVLHTPRVRRLLLAELNLAAEQLCDEQAARAVGDRLTVAETILELTKLTRQALPMPGAAFVGASSTERRIHALLGGAASGARVLPKATWFAAAVIALVFAASGPLHHAVETLLSVLQR